MESTIIFKYLIIYVLIITITSILIIISKNNKDAPVHIPPFIYKNPVLWFLFINAITIGLMCLAIINLPQILKSIFSITLKILYIAYNLLMVCWNHFMIKLLNYSVSLRKLYYRYISLPLYKLYYRYIKR